MNLYELFILGVNIKYIVFSILYKHINVPMAYKELKVDLNDIKYYAASYKSHLGEGRGGEGEQMSVYGPPPPPPTKPFIQQSVRVLKLKQPPTGGCTSCTGNGNGMFRGCPPPPPRFRDWPPPPLRFRDWPPRP